MGPVSLRAGPVGDGILLQPPRKPELARLDVPLIDVIAARNPPSDRLLAVRVAASRS